VPTSLTKEHRRDRERVLEDDEIAALWRAAERQCYPHGTLVQFLLLSALRRNEAAQLRRSEVDAEFTKITLPPARNKTKIVIQQPLSPAAAELLRSCPPGEWFFVGEYGKPFRNFSREKRTLDRMSNVGDWVLHDLRRTAATLMERAGVRVEVIEACLGHTKRGIVKVYQRHKHAEEKRQALEALAQMILSIVDPTAANNVIPLARGA
jgi:integrase